MAKKQNGSPSKTKAAPRGKSKPSKVANPVVAAGDMTSQNKRTGSAAAPKQRGLSTELIGEAAGNLWRVLNERGAQTLAGLKKSVDGPDELALLAVGWLAREDKLSFETTGRTLTVSLREGG